MFFLVKLKKTLSQLSSFLSVLDSNKTFRVIIRTEQRIWVFPSLSLILTRTFFIWEVAISKFLLHGRCHVSPKFWPHGCTAKILNLAWLRPLPWPRPQPRGRYIKTESHIFTFNLKLILVSVWKQLRLQLQLRRGSK